MPWYQRIVRLLQTQSNSTKTVLPSRPRSLAFNCLLYALLVLALSRPQLLEAPIERILPARDLLLVVDLSGSMEANDFTLPDGTRTDRLSAVKNVLDDFLTRRQGDRVGLIVFGSAPFVQVPFTQDLNACRTLLEETTVRMAGPRTVFGDAIGLGIHLFERSKVNKRVLIVLTDGNDTGSKIPPSEAAAIARDQGVTIHVVGVGDPATTGEDQLDEAALRSVAQTTGGSYFHAQNGTALKAIYEEIDRIGSRDIEKESYRPRRELFHWPLAVAGLLSISRQTLQLFLRKEPAHG
jgi:Ca-activated chloride channel family protein